MSDEWTSRPDLAANADPRANVRREAELLAVALAQSLRQREASSRPPESDSDPGCSDDPAGHAGPSKGAATDPSKRRGRAGGAAPSDSAGLAEILTGAGLVARGGLELMGGVMSRLLEASASPPGPSRPDRRADVPGRTDLAEDDREAAGRPRMIPYRRTPRRIIPVVDAPRLPDLA